MRLSQPVAHFSALLKTRGALKYGIRFFCSFRGNRSAGRFFTPGLIPLMPTTRWGRIFKLGALLVFGIFVCMLENKTSNELNKISAINDNY